MCEVLWRNIFDFYVNLRDEVGKHPQVILAMYFLSWTRMIIIKITNDRIKIITGNEKYSQKQDFHFTSCQNMYNVDQDTKCVHKQTCVFGSPSQQSLYVFI
jgi:hypothetical protein